MVTAVTETCRCNKLSCTVEHLRKCAFVGFCKPIIFHTLYTCAYGLSLCQISHASLQLFIVIKPYGKESSVGSHIFNISQEYYKKFHNLRISTTKPHFRTLQKAVTVSRPSKNFARPPYCFYSEVVNCMAFGVLQGHNSNKISLELVIR